MDGGDHGGRILIDTSRCHHARGADRGGTALDGPIHHVRGESGPGGIVQSGGHPELGGLRFAEHHRRRRLVDADRNDVGQLACIAAADGEINRSDGLTGSGGGVDAIVNAGDLPATFLRKRGGDGVVRTGPGARGERQQADDQNPAGDPHLFSG